MRCSCGQQKAPICGVFSSAEPSDGLEPSTPSLPSRIRHCGQVLWRLHLEKLVERMPDDAPPKWMFRIICTIRENTDRILALLEREDAAVTAEPASAAA